jgi:hypothetical protein
MALHLLRLPGPALVASAHHQRYRIDLCHRPAPYPENQGLRLAYRDLNPGLQGPPNASMSVTVFQYSTTAKRLCRNFDGCIFWRTFLLRKAFGGHMRALFPFYTHSPGVALGKSSTPLG